RTAAWAAADERLRRNALRRENGQAVLHSQRQVAVRAADEEALAVVLPPRKFDGHELLSFGNGGELEVATRVGRVGFAGDGDGCASQVDGLSGDREKAMHIAGD